MPFEVRDVSRCRKFECGEVLALSDGAKMRVVGSDHRILFDQLAEELHEHSSIEFGVMVKNGDVLSITYDSGEHEAVSLACSSPGGELQPWACEENSYILASDGIVDDAVDDMVASDDEIVAAAADGGNRDKVASDDEVAAAAEGGDRAELSARRRAADEGGELADAPPHHVGAPEAANFPADEHRAAQGEEFWRQHRSSAFSGTVMKNREVALYVTIKNPLLGEFFGIKARVRARAYERACAHRPRPRPVARRNRRNRHPHAPNPCLHNAPSHALEIPALPEIDHVCATLFF